VGASATFGDAPELGLVIRLSFPSLVLEISVGDSFAVPERSGCRLLSAGLRFGVRGCKQAATSGGAGNRKHERTDELGM